METMLANKTVWLTAEEIEFYTAAPAEVAVKTVRNSKIQLVLGDITDLDADAIVVSANPYLQLCSGIAGAVRERGGAAIQEECDQIGYTPAGEAVITPAGSLDARCVIHAVGPLQYDTNRSTLASATHASLALADAHALTSIAFPAIAAEHGYPLDKCAHVMISAVMDYLRTTETGLERVVFCLPDAEPLAVFETQLAGYSDTDALLELTRRWAGER